MALVSISRSRSSLFFRRYASTYRAVFYAQNGDPSTVLSVMSYPALPPPPRNTVNIRYLLSPINPADINVIEGVYASKPSPTSDLALSGKGSPEEPVFIGGNEGLAVVTDVGQGVANLKKDDWVIMSKPQAGTWSGNRNIGAADAVKLPNTQRLSQVQAATMTVNPPTAYNMLHDFVTLAKDDWVVQNGANSAVGQAVIQIAAANGWKTLNFVRNRDNLSELVQQLEDIGATKVYTYDELFDKSFRAKIKNLTGGNIPLGLNCVGGKETSLMTGLLGEDAHLVSYGAMSKQPLSLPTSFFIFKNLTSHGYWQSRWYANQPKSVKETVFRRLTDLMREGKLKEPEYEILTISASESDDAATQRIRQIFAKMSQGRYGKKVLLQFVV